MAKMDMFQKFNTYIEEENEIREKIREIVRQLDIDSKEATVVLQVIHVSITDVSQACLQARKIFEKCRLLYLDLAKLIPPGQYYRYSDHWNWTTQRLISSIALVVYMEAGFLVSRDTCAELLGMKNNQSDGFHLDLECYLMGILQMVSELSRFATNTVTLGDCSRVLSLQRFVADISSGFRLLNLKNDALRKRFDSLKYDVKKIEEIVYDLSIRGLLKVPEAGEAPEGSVAMKED